MIITYDNQSLKRSLMEKAMKKIALATAFLIASAGAFAQSAKNDAPAAPAPEMKQDTKKHAHPHKDHHKKSHAEGKAATTTPATPAAPATPATPPTPAK